jgi:hypothetical protein
LQQYSETLEQSKKNPLFVICKSTFDKKIFSGTS